MIILYFYLFTSLIVAIRLGAYIAFSLDQYDWQYNQYGIWVAIVLCTIFWPLLLIKPMVLINPRSIFTTDLDFASSSREYDRLRDNPPPCGTAIRYHPAHQHGEDVFGEFLFRAEDVEQVLRQTLKESPHLSNTDEGALLSWVKNHDETLTGATDVPELWSRFKYIADKLVRSGKAKIRCRECNASLKPDQLQTNDDTGKAGWNFNRLVCPQGHNLLVTENVHLLMRKQ